MKFICLCHYDQAKFAACTPEDFQAVAVICAPRDRQLQASGHADVICSVAAPADYAVIRPGENGPTVARGAYADTSEPWGAYFVVDADDIEQAIEIAKLHPGAHLGRYFGGGIEVRPCHVHWPA